MQSLRHDHFPGLAAARMIFTGRLQPQSFGAFMQERAQRLALDATIEALGPGRASVRVAGQRGLVDAFEMACSLGPRDCVVVAVERSELTEAW